jgi:hypothetical protein
MRAAGCRRAGDCSDTDSGATPDCVIAIWPGGAAVPRGRAGTTAELMADHEMERTPGLAVRLQRAVRWD